MWSKYPNVQYDYTEELKSFDENLIRSWCNFLILDIKHISKQILAWNSIN